MLNVEQFIYTTASIGNKKGYQIIAKSKGITEKIISDLESYFYPIGVEPSEFKESCSLILLEDDLIAYSRIKNIGLGYDGRDNTLYNHSLIFSKNDFKLYDNDSRIFDEFYLEDESIRGVLPTLSINPTVPSFPLELDGVELILEPILSPLFLNQRIVLNKDDIKLPQKILSLLPISLRLISFSTLVVNPYKQPKFCFILGSRLNKYQFKKNYTLITSDKISTFDDKTSFKSSIVYYSELIRLHKFEKLKEIHKSFEEIPCASYRNKLILLCNYSKFQTTIDENEKEQLAKTILKMLKKFDRKTFSFYFDKIKRSLKQYELLEKQLEPKLDHSMSFIDAFFFLPSQMMANLFNTFGKYRQYDDEEEN